MLPYYYKSNKNLTYFETRFSLRIKFVIYDRNFSIFKEIILIENLKFLFITYS